MQGRPRDGRPRRRSLFQRGVEQQRGRQAPHPDQPVHRLARAADAERAVRAPQQGLDVEIDARRETTVQPHLLAAEMAARLGRAVVQEGMAHRLLELPGEAVGQEHPGHVRLPRLDRAAGMRVGGGGAEEGDLLRKAGGGVWGLRAVHDRGAALPSGNARPSLRIA